MNAEEVMVALRGGESRADAVPRGYPLLRDRGATLRDRGVWFDDLSFAFRDVSEPFYVDNCCHLARRGNELLAAAMAAAMASNSAPAAVR